MAPDAAGQWTLRIGGWAVAAERPPDQQEDPGSGSVRGADGLTSSVIGLHGSMIPGVHRPAGTHAFGPHFAVPYLYSAEPAGPGDTYAAAVSLSADPADSGEPPALTIAAGDAGQVTATIRWPDGEQDQLSLLPGRQAHSTGAVWPGARPPFAHVRKPADTEPVGWPRHG